jgi:hypothetical protein
MALPQDLRGLHDPPKLGIVVSIGETKRKMRIKTMAALENLLQTLV